MINFLWSPKWPKFYPTTRVCVPCQESNYFWIGFMAHKIFTSLDELMTSNIFSTSRNGLKRKNYFSTSRIGPMVSIFSTSLIGLTASYFSSLDGWALSPSRVTIENKLKIQILLLHEMSSISKSCYFMNCISRTTMTFPASYGESISGTPLLWYKLGL